LEQIVIGLLGLLSLAIGAMAYAVRQITKSVKNGSPGAFVPNGGVSLMEKVVRLQEQHERSAVDRETRLTQVLDGMLQRGERIESNQNIILDRTRDK